MAKTKEKQLAVMVKELNDLYNSVPSYQRLFGLRYKNVNWGKQYLISVCGSKNGYIRFPDTKTTDDVIIDTIKALKQIYNKENIYIAHHPYLYDNGSFFLAIYVFIY